MRRTFRCTRRTGTALRVGVRLHWAGSDVKLRELGLDGDRDANRRAAVGAKDDASHRSAKLLILMGELRISAFRAGRHPLARRNCGSLFVIGDWHNRLLHLLLANC